MRNSFVSYWPVLSSLLLALLLSIFTMPESWLWLRPQWLALVCLYWLVLAPQRLPLALVWFAGLLLDLLTATPLGLHAMALVVLSYFTSKIVRHWQIHHPIAQSLMIVVLIILYVALLLWGMQVLAGIVVSPWAWLSTITTSALWILICPKSARVVV